MKTVVLSVIGLLLFIPAFVASCVLAGLLARTMGAPIDGAQLATAAVGGIFTAAATVAAALIGRSS